MENAFKYGTTPEVQSSIEITFDVKTENKISFTIKNAILNEPHQQDVGGSGLKATRERLQIAYPNRHSLKITDTNQFVVELTLYHVESNHR